MNPHTFEREYNERLSGMGRGEGRSNRDTVGIREAITLLSPGVYSSVIRTAYLECMIAEPLSPVARGLVIDKLAGPSAGWATRGRPADHGVRPTGRFSDTSID
jgi:hypothetical protein